MKTTKGTKMTKMALKITTDAKIVKLSLDNNTELAQLQEAVDGYIEAVDLSPNLTMWVNEEGLLRDDLSINPVAYAFYSQPIMGDIVFTGGTDGNGDTIGLSEAEAKLIRSVVKSCRMLLV